MEEIIKQKLINRGFSKETILNNRGLISALIEDVQEQLRIGVVVGRSEQYFCCKEQIKQRCGEQCLGCYMYANDKV